MASAAATMSRAVPAIPMQHIPRIRPPRFLKGEPRDDQLPQPEGEVPQGQVWVQGKWRNRSSNAAKHHQRIRSDQVAKAIEKEAHGCNIYAYYHILTKQVVYSTTRNMQSGQIMPQLLYHGKKTVPAALRRDLWRPYFSVHFPPNDAGMKTGLQTYHRLRDIAQRRQLSPPPEMLMTTQKDIDDMIYRAGNPLQALSKYLHGTHRRHLRPPVLGSKLPKTMRAAKLMNHKATSVADVAFTLEAAKSQLLSLYDERFDAAKAIAQRTDALVSDASRRARKRLKDIRKREEEKAVQIADRAASVDEVKPGSMGLDKHVARRLSMEFDGAIEGKKTELRVLDMSELPSKSGQNYDEPAEVEILWADMRDGSFAAEWPDNVYHAPMQPLAYIKKAITGVRQAETVDVDGTVISEQRQKRIIIAGSSQHVHGRVKPVRFNTSLQEAIAETQKRRESRHEVAEEQLSLQRVKDLQSLYSTLQKTDIQVLQLESIRERSALGSSLKPAEAKLLSQQEQILESQSQTQIAWDAAEDEYPDEAASAKEAFARDEAFAEEAILFDEMVQKLMARDPKSTSAEAALVGPSDADLKQAAPQRYASALEFMQARKESVGKEELDELRTQLIEDLVAPHLERPASQVVVDSPAPGFWQRITGAFSKA